MMPRPLALCMTLIFTVLTACGTNNHTSVPDASDSTTDSPEGNTLPGDNTGGADPADATDPSDTEDFPDATDTDEDAADGSEPEPIDPACDEDGDGYASRACGGDDCDDANRFAHPDQIEYCDFIDNNCDEVINENLVCTVYAHTSSTLYEVDPFLGTIETISSVPGLFDFDTTVDGGLYGITSSSLYSFNEASNSWDFLGSISGMAGTSNGFAIDSTGRAFATSGSNVYEVNLSTAAFTLVGDMGSGVNSSGDCVVDKSDGLFMTSNGTSATNGDDLVQINTFTGETTTIGSTGFGEIYGLTSAYGYMFGFTGSGELVLLDMDTGAGTLLYEFPGNAFYGAASSPVR